MAIESTSWINSRCLVFLWNYRRMLVEPLRWSYPNFRDVQKITNEENVKIVYLQYPKIQNKKSGRYNLQTPRTSRLESRKYAKITRNREDIIYK